MANTIGSIFLQRLVLTLTKGFMGPKRCVPGSHMSNMQRNKTIKQIKCTFQKYGGLKIIMLYARKLF